MTSAPPRRRQRPNVLLVVGAILLGLVVLTTLVSLVWTPGDPITTNPSNRLAESSREHWLGTDGAGRDVASALMAGSRIPLLVGAGVVAISFAIGVPFGMLSAMASRTTGTWLMRWNDIVQAFPPLLLAIVLAAVIGGGTSTAILALGIGASPGVARVVRAGTRQVLSREYALAARAAGRGPLFVAVRHVLPNIRGILIVQATVGFALAVLAEAALSYLGLGTTPPTPSWGWMLKEAQGAVYARPLLVVWPGIAIAITVLGLNLLGDGVRDRYDPRLEGER
nr:ABC transporter permease [Actinomycetales bacterium]